MLTQVFLEAVSLLLIHLAPRDLLALLGLVEVELRLRGDGCAGNYCARAAASYRVFAAEHLSRDETGPRVSVDSGDGASA